MSYTELIESRAQGSYVRWGLLSHPEFQPWGPLVLDFTYLVAIWLLVSYRSGSRSMIGTVRRRISYTELIESRAQGSYVRWCLLSHPEFHHWGPLVLVLTYLVAFWLFVSDRSGSRSMMGNIRRRMSYTELIESRAQGKNVRWRLLRHPEFQS